MKKLVLLHGWGMTPAVFDGFAERLSAHLHVMALELPAYRSEAPGEPWTLERMARELARRAPDRCCVAGWSLGAQVALAWAHAAPHQVERLALFAATPCFVEREDWAHGVEMPVLRQFAAALREDASATLKRFASLQARGDERARQVIERLRAALVDTRHSRLDTLECALHVLLESDLREVLPTIAQPALVVHGERDALAPLAAARYLARALPRARFALLAGAAHAPFISDPAAASALVLEFLHER